MASEKLRQREVHKYYQSWLDSSIGFDATKPTHSSRFHADGSQLRSSKDNALTAFAQLACLRLNVKRSIVTLISTDLQYILAEATKTLSLVSGRGDAEAGDEIWFGNSLLPRSQGISGDALYPPNYTAKDTDGSLYTGPALVIDDLVAQGRYKSRAYVGNGISFYCGVPIVTQSGLPIGVYTITDDIPRNGLSANELKFMHDMAATVMRHLEIVSSEAARFRGEKMVQGLGRFVSGASTLHDNIAPVIGPSNNDTPSSFSPTEASFVRDSLGLTVTAANPSRLRRIGADGISQTILYTVAEPSERGDGGGSPKLEDPLSPVLTGSKPGLDTHSSEAQSTSPNSLVQLTVDKPHNTVLEDVFSRAARILQECVVADGVMFFDAISMNSTGRVNTTTWVPSDKGQSANTSAPNPVTATELGGYSAFDLSATSEESDMEFSNDSERKICKLLGFSVDSSTEPGLATNLLKNPRITERGLRRLIKLFPQGKLFNFREGGTFSASDGTESASGAKAGSSRVVLTDESKRVPHAIARELEKLVPHAQSIIWLPLWDFGKKRWGAGLFLWSKTKERMSTALDDLVYLKAFGNSIMIEVARLDAALADTAKATFIANISHELRTPLHGVLGNLDILQDTILSGFQKSLLISIEICARTLTETVDHVLDYSKINQLTKQSRQKSTPGVSQLSSVRHEFTFSGGQSMMEEDFDMAVVVEEAVEAACASHAFQFSGHTRLRTPSLVGKRRTETAPDSSQKPADVRVILNIEHRENWFVRSQTSAIRRIITNLFGNALKYTERGRIEVVLSRAPTSNQPDDDSTVSIVLSITDTGKGMSADFVRNHAFTPFSQESQFSTGTGLGLSIVKQIVKRLDGTIDLKSDQGVGTSVKVFLNLPLTFKEDVLRSTAMTIRIKQLLPKTSGLFLQFSTVNERENSSETPEIGSIRSSIETIAHTWYGVQTTRAHSSDCQSSKLVLYLSPPTIDEMKGSVAASDHPVMTQHVVVASNSIQQAELAENYQELGSQLGISIDVLSYPLGPQKIGKMVLNCLEQIGANQIAKHHISTKPRGRGATPVHSSDVQNSAVPSLHVLLVDDNEINLTILKTCMKRARLRFDSAKDGLQASNMVQRATLSGDPFTHILMDISMPVMDGIQATREIRGFERRQANLQRLSSRGEESDNATLPAVSHMVQIPEIEDSAPRTMIIALSGMVASVTQSEMLEAGADMFMAKPVKMKELLKVLVP